MRTTTLLIALSLFASFASAQITVMVDSATEKSVTTRLLTDSMNKVSTADTLFHAVDTQPPIVNGIIWVELTYQKKTNAPAPLNSGAERVWCLKLQGLNGQTITLPTDGQSYMVRCATVKVTTATDNSDHSNTVDAPADFLLISESGTSQKTILALEKGQGEEVGCGAYTLYFIGPYKPGKLDWKTRCRPFLSYKRLAPEGFIRTQRGKGEKIFRTYLGDDFCEQKLHLNYVAKGKETGHGRYYLVPLDARMSFHRSIDQSGGTGDGPFNSSSSFAKYRITYDVRQSQIYVQRRLRHDRGNGLWKTVNSRVIRPGVNRMIDVRMINFNELRDSVSAGYSFENLNQQNSAEYLNAVFSIPTGTAAAVEGTAKPKSAEGSFQPPSYSEETLAQKQAREEKAKKDTAVVDLDRLDALYETFQAELKTAQGASVTPDKELLKAKLDKLVSTKFPDYFTSGSTKPLGDGLREVIATGKKYKLVSDEKEKELDKKVTEVERIYGLLTTYRAFALAPIQMRDYDLLQLQFKLNGKPLNQSAYEIYSKGGWKIDFSTGVVLTSLRDSKFFLDGIRSSTDTLGVDTASNAPITKTTYFSTTRESTKEPFDWGVAVMAHLYPRLGIIPNISITTGAMIRQEGVRWLGGASVLLGRRERLVLTGGVAWGKVDRLKDGRQTETETSSETVITEDTVVPTQKVNDTGWFISASWNFGGARLTR